MKKQRVLAADARSEIDLLWEVIILILTREKELHGSTMVQGRDGGSNCLKKQMGPFKLIRMQNVDEIVNEFAKQYQFIKKKRPSVALQKSLEAAKKPVITPMDVRNNNVNPVKVNEQAQITSSNNTNISQIKSSLNMRNGQNKLSMNGSQIHNKKQPVDSDSDSESSESEDEEQEEPESPEPEKEDLPELSEKEIAELCANTEKLLEEAKLRRQKKADERRKLLEEQSKLEEELKKKARRLREETFVGDDDVDDGTMDFENSVEIKPNSKASSSIIFDTNLKHDINNACVPGQAQEKHKTIFCAVPNISSKTDTELNDNTITTDFQHRIMESIMENELTMEHNEVDRRIDNESSIMKDSFSKSQTHVVEDEKSSTAHPKENVSTLRNVLQTSNELSVNDITKTPNINITTSPTNIQDFIKMVDSKIGEMKEISTKNDSNFDLATQDIIKLEDEIAIKPKFNQEHERNCPSDDVVMLKVGPSGDDEDFSLGKTHTDKIDDLVVTDELSETRKEGSYEKVMKYLKTQKDIEKKRNDFILDENIPKNNKTDEKSVSDVRANLDETEEPNNSNKIETGIKTQKTNINNDKINESLLRLPENKHILGDENVPDNLGYKSIGTQTMDFKMCTCCCQCNKLIDQ